MPGQFQGLTGIVADKNNRIFTSEMFPGRVQQFRYVTDAEAEQQRKEREEQRARKAGGAAKESTPTPLPVSEPKAPESK